MNLSKYRHIIWDWNGTLINDTWVCAEIVNVCLKKRRMSLIDIDLYRNTYELPVVNFYKRIGFDCSQEEFKELSEEFLDIYENRQFEYALQEGAIEALDFFKRQGIEQSILSAYQQHRLEKAVERFGIIDYFNHIYGRKDSLASGKGEIAQKLTGELNCINNNLLFIGDTTHDFDIAQKTGADCVLVSEGHYSTQRLQSCQANVLTSLTELLEI
ncbi:MAG: HAD family hydrolase [Planctomycetota bacterium]